MKLQNRWIGLAVILALLPAFSGCATVLRGTRHGIGIASQPPGAEVMVDNKNLGVTPVSAKLRRKDNHHITIKLQGYEPYEVVLTRQTSGWVFGNILFGPFVLVGLAVDAISGGMYTLKPDQVTADLLPAGAGARVEEGTLLVVLVPEAKPEWQKIGQLQLSHTVVPDVDSR